eukprot:8517513-Pyramimonas_sp.AAC.1
MISASGTPLGSLEGRVGGIEGHRETILGRYGTLLASGQAPRPALKRSGISDRDVPGVDWGTFRSVPPRGRHARFLAEADAPTTRDTPPPGPREGVGGGVKPSPKGKKGGGNALNHLRPKGLEEFVFLRWGSS